MGAAELEKIMAVWRTTFSEVPNGFQFFMHGDKRVWVRRYDGARTVDGKEERCDIPANKPVRMHR